MLPDASHIAEVWGIVSLVAELHLIFTEWKILKGWMTPVFPRLTLVFPISLIEQLSWEDRWEKPAIMESWHIMCEDIWEPHFLILLLQIWIKLVYKTYIFVTTKLTYEQRFLWGMTSEEPAVLKDVCKWNSQSKKLTERPGTSPGIYTHWKREHFGCISKTEVFTSINILRHAIQNLEVCVF